VKGTLHNYHPYYIISPFWSEIRKAETANQAYDMAAALGCPRLGDRLEEIDSLLTQYRDKIPAELFDKLDSILVGMRRR
jgi:hypothetical protein